MTTTRAAMKQLTPGELARRGQTLAKPRPLTFEDIETIGLIGEILLEKGEPLLAYEILSSVPEESRGDVRLRRCLGLALARTGAAEEAQLFLVPLCKELQKHCDELQEKGICITEEEKISLEESLSLLGRTYKDLGLPQNPGEPIRDRQKLRTAYHLYSDAYKIRMNYFPGINLAFLCQTLGEKSMAEEIATKVYEQCRRLEEESAERTPYWILATRGEAAVTLGLENEARAAYAQAGNLCRAASDFGSLSSMTRQLRYLLAALGRDPCESADYLRIPRIAVFAGHMADRPERAHERFPERLAGDVKREIAAWLEREDVKIGYSSAACGSDLLFIEAILERGGESHVFLPFSAEEFCNSSVDITNSKMWKNIFKSILNEVSVEVISQRELTFGEVAYDYANQLLHGAAILRADQLGTELRRLAVWDGLPGDGPGGTSDVLSQWLQLTPDIEVIRVPNIAPAAPLSVCEGVIPKHRSLAASSSQSGLRTQVAALLFADVKGFSKLTEHQIPIFVDKFLGAVASLLDDKYPGTEKRNTWGDGLYIAFDRVEDAGLFAVELAEIVKTTDWTEHGLPADLGLRTALHAGPIYLCTDPVTKRPNCIGTNVSHTARLEPSTPPNQVYASAQFAAMTVAMGITQFTCRYIGHVDWAKGYGVFPTYHVLL